MRERVVRTEVIHLRGRAAVLEVEIREPEPPGRVRRWLALLLIRIAGRLAGMRVRVVAQDR